MNGELVKDAFYKMLSTNKSLLALGLNNICFPSMCMKEIYTLVEGHEKLQEFHVYEGKAVGVKKETFFVGKTKVKRHFK